MRAFSLICFLGIVLSTQALNSQRRLIARSSDDDKQLLRGEVTITQASASCTEASLRVKSSCDKKDTVELQQSVSTVKASVTELSTVVQTFDGQRASTHKTTVVGVFSSYFSMIDTISNTPDGTKVCKEQLVEINQAFQSISSVYSKKGIDLSTECKHDPQFRPDAFNQLDLPLPFAEKTDKLADNHDNTSTEDDQPLASNETANTTKDPNDIQDDNDDNSNDQLQNNSEDEPEDHHVD